jgi:AmmeMemoRadiSam system protein B
MATATSVRRPAVAGQFYPDDPATLRREVRSFLVDGKKERALGCIVPHAGYVYSGHVAGAVFSRIDLPKRFIILCPNHSGFGAPLAIMSSGTWSTPLGEAKIDISLAEALKQAFPYLEEDATAHLREHSLEVQIPFLQELVAAFTFVPICIGTGQLAVLQALGQAIAQVVRAQQEPVLVIASSDMNHYENDEITRIKDERAIQPILALDPAGLHETVKREHITMCGYAPATAMLTAAKALGATRAELVKHATSGDIFGERNRVVGYAGITIA